jgi:hypothetical protein
MCKFVKLDTGASRAGVDVGGGNKTEWVRINYSGWMR